GGFVANYKSSAIDHVQGMIHPPSKSLTFNENLVVNDGILVNHLKSKYGKTLEEAKEIIRDFVAELKAKIEEREIIVFPEVGRLYRDYENKLQFLPDNSNYNLDVYGLPTVQYYPIIRNRDSAPAEAPAPKATPMRKPAAVAKRRSQQRKWQPIAVYSVFALILVMLSLSVYTIYNNMNGSDDVQSLPVSENRLNTKPTKDGSEIDDQFGTEITTSETADEEFESNSETGDEIDYVPAVSDTESSTLAPDQKECVVIIGGFRSKDNVRKLIERLYNKGFDAYQDQKNGITRVGAQFFYETEAQRREKVKFIRDQFEAKAWVLKE
ncbi:MAG: hypothetical protein AAFO94_08970, partial [Bacteroidota bacterium]